MNKALISLACLLLLIGCNPKSNNISIPAPNNRIIPIMGDIDRQTGKLSLQDQLDEQEVIPHIPISSDYIVLNLVETNIDGDDDDEQIIITQPLSQDDTPAALEIWIAEYKNTRNEYVLSWKSKLKAEIQDGLVILTKDITGTLTNEILITGFTQENYQTLDMFETQGTISQMDSLFSISARGSIELEYQEQLGNNAQNPQRQSMEIHISETEASEEDADQFILINTVWTLNNRTMKFVKTSQVRKAQDDQKREEMTNIIQGDEEVFLNYLEGFWYLEGAFAGEDSLAMLYFNPREESIIFYIDDEFELYEIQYAHKGIYSKIYINSINSNIKNSSRSMTVSLEELDRFTLTVEDNNDKTAVQSSWAGSYRKMGDSLLQNLRNPINQSLLLSESILKGKYKNDNGNELNFDTAPLFTFKEEGKEINGSFSILKKDDQLLLELVFLNRKSMVTERKFYSFILNEEEDENYIVRSLILTPGKLTIRGFQPSGERNIGYEQLEVLQ